MTAYQTLEARAKRIADIEGALAILGWDAQTMMPKGGSDARGVKGFVVRRIVVAEELLDDL